MKPSSTTANIVILAFMAGLAVPASEAQKVPEDVAALASADSSAFAPTIPNQTPAPTNAPEGMVWIPGGEFSMGCVVPSEGICTAATIAAVNDAQPVHRVQVNGFWMDKTDVTNEKFEQFVKAAGYVTVAER